MSHPLVLAPPEAGRHPATRSGKPSGRGLVAASTWSAAAWF